MAYIGHSPSTGEDNNFKILDDISSYTLTFDGSSSSVVSTSDETIYSYNHRFVQGQRVTYNNGGGGNITGLTSGTVYFIIKEDHNNIKLATSASNAAAGTAVNITAVGSGTSHTLNVAFDGVNTKFKATHTTGQKARITRGAQLVISINGVIQQPHDSSTPSTGFGFDVDGTIILSQAPESSDAFWGHILTNNNVTFDISDNKIDHFTGDGSTSSFTLSKSPPNNENILVTIDGVVQYPNDSAGNIRAYTVAANVISFASAPGSGTQIEVRHIGFAGATSGGGGGVTGFYGRTGNSVLKSTDHITTGNIVAGVVTATNAVITGDLTVNGTTTTLDTNLIGVDRLEVDANNTTVAVAVTQSGAGDILQLFDGTDERLRIKSNGRVGIGTDNPSTSLQVDAGAVTLNSLLKTTSASSLIGFQHNAGSSYTTRIGSKTLGAGNVGLAFDTGTSGGSTKMTIDVNGKVGIGTDVNLGDAKLTAEGVTTLANIDQTIMVRDSNADDAVGRGGNIGFGAYVNGTMRTLAGIGALKTNAGNSFNGDLALYTRENGQANLSERLRITSAGKLQVKGTRGGNLQPEDDDTLQLYTASTDNSTNRGSGITFYNHDNSGYEMGGTIQVAKENGTADNVAAYMRFSTRPAGGSATERLRITSGGQTLFTGVSGTTPLDIKTSNSSNNTVQPIIEAYADNATYKARIGLVREGSSGLLGWAFLTNAVGSPTEKLRITSAGRVGVGTITPHTSYRFDIRHTSDSILHLGQNNNSLAGMSNDSWNAVSFQGTNCELGLYKDNSGNFSYIMGTYQGSTDIPLVFRSGNRAERLRITLGGEIVTQGLTGATFDNDGANTKIFEVTGDGTVGEYGVINISGNQNADDGTLGIIKFINRENSASSSGSNAGSRQLGSIEMRADTGDTNAGDDCGGYFRFITKADGGGNAERLRITSGGNFNFANPSSGNIITNDQSTVYANAAINIYRLGNGYADMRLSSNYGAKVALAGASNNTDEFYIQQDNQKNAYIVNEAEKEMYFQTNSATRMTVAAGGGVGIGLTNPTYKLDISGITRITNDAANTATDMNVSGALTLRNLQDAKGTFIDFIADSANGTSGMMAKIGGWNAHAGSGYSGELTFSTRNGSNMHERLRIDSSGKVTINPYNTFHSPTHQPTLTLSNESESNLYEGGKWSHAAIGINNTTHTANGGSKSQIVFGYLPRAGGYDFEYGSAYMGATSVSQSGAGKVDLVFGTKDDTSDTQPTERLRIASDGEVFIGEGFGDTNRSTLLSISGANQDPNAVWTQIGVYSSDSQAANKGGSIGFGGQDGTTAKQQFAAIAGVKENGTSGNYAGYMAFYTRPAGAVSQERLRITSGGRVSINKTSGDIDGALHIAAMSDNAITIEGANAAINWRYQDGSAHYRGGIKWNSSGEVKFDAGVSGNSYYYCWHLNNGERMRLDQSGRLGIGAGSNPRAYLDSRETVSGTPLLNLGFNEGSFYRNLGTVGPTADDGRAASSYQYLHVRLRTVWNDASMTMFRITGYNSYNDYTESYVGMYRYNNNGYRTNPYGQIVHNQKRATLHSIYNTGADPGYLVLVLDSSSNYMGYMIEHIGAGGSYASYMQQDLEIIDTKRDTTTSDQWPS